MNTRLYVRVSVLIAAPGDRAKGVFMSVEVKVVAPGAGPFGNLTRRVERGTSVGLVKSCLPNLAR